ncbi:transglycosylase [Brevundimonas sp. VNH65]|uniref:transglycosylase n=1 Tax=Brevundimonas sp. VNH65 TaxID=3400917 RepID=UPI003C01A123
MPGDLGKIKADFVAGEIERRWRKMVQYADIAVAVAGALAIAWIADLLTGRRGYIATLLVSGTGAACGWFLATRVFAVATMDDWVWVAWAFAASVLSLIGYFLFRNKR